MVIRSWLKILFFSSLNFLTKTDLEQLYSFYLSWRCLNQFNLNHLNHHFHYRHQNRLDHCQMPLRQLCFSYHFSFFFHQGDFWRHRVLLLSPRRNLGFSFLTFCNCCHRMMNRRRLFSFCHLRRCNRCCRLRSQLFLMVRQLLWNGVELRLQLRLLHRPRQILIRPSFSF